MGYAKLLDTNLIRAFNIVKDLAVDATLVHKVDPTFNFGTSSVSVSATANTVVKAILIDGEKKSQERNVVEKTYMLKSKDLLDLTLFDSLIISGETWNIGPTLKDDGYVKVQKVFREV